MSPLHRRRPHSRRLPSCILMDAGENLLRYLSLEWRMGWHASDTLSSFSGALMTLGSMMNHSLLGFHSRQCIHPQKFLYACFAI